MYTWAPLIRIASAPQTATAEEYLSHSSFTLRGIIVREEIPIPMPKHMAVFTAADGQAVAAGSTLALCGDEVIPAPAAGIFTQETDGYEHLTTDMFSEISLHELQLLQLSDASDNEYLGKIISGSGWLLAAEADSACADSLREGQSTAVTVQSDTPFAMNVTVIHISPEQQGKCAVVFRCIDRLQQTYHLRQLTVLLPNTTLEGLRVPTETIHTDEAGCFVYILSASKAEKTYVTILSTETDFTIVSKDSSADALRAGDTILISAPS